MTKRNRYEQRKVFLQANGPGPWPCFGCGELVQPDELRVHHVDEDVGNNVPDNLVSMHNACHLRLHHTGKQVSSATRLKLAASQRGKSHSEETRRKIGAASRGLRRSPETRAKMSVAHRGAPRDLPRFRCGGCDLITISTALIKHQNASGHEGRARVQEKVMTS